MKNKSLIFSIFLVFIIVLGVSAISAQDVDDLSLSDGEDAVSDLPTTDTGVVSGDVAVVTENPGSTAGELNYDIPSDAKTIKSADVYVNVYSGSAKNTHGANANISITTVNGKTDYSECLWTEKGSTDGVIYTVNDHITKCYSDYMIHYNVTNLLNGLNGTALKINVDTFKYANKSFDGRIKLIALVLAYDDGDDDVINYWVNSGQAWTKTNTSTIFNTNSINNVLEAYLTNIALSSSDAAYTFNDEFMDDAKDHVSGTFYYQYNYWDVTGILKEQNPNKLTSKNVGTSSYASIKNVLSVLKIKTGDFKTSVSLATERSGKVISDTSLPIAYPGLSNTISITVNTNKNGKYTVKLFADGNEVNSTEVYLTSGSQIITLIDNTIRPVDESTFYTGRTGNYNTVNYTAELLLNDESLNNKSIDAYILYNGYFNKDLYGQNSLEPFYNGAINGDIVIEICDSVGADGNSAKYASGTTNRVDNWTVSLNDGSYIVKALIYVPYTYISGDNVDMFNVAFNKNSLTPIAFIRDQSNAVGNQGYGVLVYDVTDYMVNGNNVFELNRTISGGIYPSTLIYLYNTTGSNVIKNVYISNGADLLGAYGNGARQLKIDSTFDLVTSDITDATVYVFCAGLEPGRASIDINGELDNNVWNSTVKNTINLYSKDITDIMKDSNTLSLILNKGMFTALQQIIVTTQKDTVAITAPSVTSVYNTAKNLIVLLKDSNGKAIANAKLTIVLNGVKKEVTTNANGQATLAIPTNLVPKTYTATINFAGDDTHIKSSSSTKVIVKKASVKLTAKKITFKAKAKTKKYTVTLKNNKGKAMKKVKLTLKVKGKTYKATTNAKGKATFKITKLTKKGKHTAKITYKGDKYFNKLTKSAKITIKK